MRLIDAEELRRALAEDPFPVSEVWEMHIDAAPTVDVPQPLTRDGVLAEVARIEAAGDTAVVEMFSAYEGEWLTALHTDWLAHWRNPDVPRWNVRVRAVPAETEDVPLTQLVGRTIKGCDKPCDGHPSVIEVRDNWMWRNGPSWMVIPPQALDLATGLVTVVKGEA